MNIRTGIFLSFLLLVSLTACAKEERNITGNQTIMTEVARLGMRSGQEKLTMEELGNLELMVAGNEQAEHELKEFKTLLQYKEYKHISHGLSFFGSYVETGKELLCPSHELAHYYVFGRHDEDHLAEEGLEEAKEQFDDWIPLARAYNEQYPGTQDFDQIVQRIQNHFDRIEAGDTSATEEEIDFLATTASICVEGE